jgi:hypothetical protein
MVDPNPWTRVAVAGVEPVDAARRESELVVETALARVALAGPQDAVGDRARGNDVGDAERA